MCVQWLERGPGEEATVFGNIPLFFNWSIMDLSSRLCEIKQYMKVSFKTHAHSHTLNKCFFGEGLNSHCFGLLLNRFLIYEFLSFAVILCVGFQMDGYRIGATTNGCAGVGC